MGSIVKMWFSKFTLSKSAGVFLKLERTTWAVWRTSVLCNLIQFLNSEFSLILQLFILFKIHCIMIHSELHDVYQCCICWLTRIVCKLQYLDLLQCVCKLNRAETCKGVEAPQCDRNLAEDKIWQGLPFSSYFNCLSPHTQLECSFSSCCLHKFQKWEHKSAVLLSLEIIPLNLKLGHFHLTNREKDGRDFGFFRPTWIKEVNYEEELSRRMIEEMLY